MARNGVAANLLMFFILISGSSFRFPTLVQEVFPEVSHGSCPGLRSRTPGPHPTRSSESIVLRIEEQVGGVAGLRRMMSTASEGAADRCWRRVEAGEGISSRFLEDVKARIDRIADPPGGSGASRGCTEVTNRQSVMRIVIHGDAFQSGR